MEDTDDEREQFIKQFDAGRYLKTLRGDRPLSDVCKNLGISKQYLSDVERGRLPSDHFLVTIADIYGVEADDLFFRFGKIPILSRKIITENKQLADTIAEIGRNEKLSDEQKERLCDMMHRTYRDFIKTIEEEKQAEKDVKT